MGWDWVAVVVTAVAAGKMLTFNATLLEAGKAMSTRDGGAVRAINYQNAISPPWLARAMITNAVLVATSVIWVGQASGGHAALWATIASFVANGLSHSVLPPRTGSPIFLRSAYRTLVNRSVDYARDNDHVRAAAVAKAAEDLAAACPVMMDGA